MDSSSCQCRDVTRQTRVKVPYFDCTLVKRNKCRTVPVTKCTKVPEKQCETKTRDVCVDTPETQCDDIHRKIPHTLKRQKPVEVRNINFLGPFLIVLFLLKTTINLIITQLVFVNKTFF